MHYYHTAYMPLTLAEWAANTKSHRLVYGVGQAWAMTREILKDHTSHSYAALMGYTYIPTAYEQNKWAEYAANKQIKNGSNYRPWTDTAHDPFGAAPLRSRSDVLRARNRIKDIYHINNGDE